VLEAASKVAEREGFQGLSMRSVARELDVSAMALYRHVADKDDLLDGLVQRLLGEVQLPDRSLSWETRLRNLAYELRALATRHPELFGLLLRRRAASPEALQVRQAAISALCAGGLDLDEATRLELLLSTTIFGFAFSEAAGRFEDLDADAEFDALLDLLARAVAR
jgi:AcrR family transcriptional regulator